ncbi:MAG TPA: hypothetical protein VGQ39_22415 [Pyrinomonadaceae bacterium]|jgi:hypothetical protein|nr:hypothetical protein [Pyrinomonadaceae bacterium]
MKKYVWLPLILLAVFGLSATRTKAQSACGVRADVPFDFIVGDKTLSAGKISVRGASASDVGPLSISNFDKGESAFRMALLLTGSDTTERGKLVFHKYGNQYFLAQVWIPGYKALELIKSRGERAIERETRLSKNSKPELVALMADKQ